MSRKGTTCMPTDKLIPSIKQGKIKKYETTPELEHATPTTPLIVTWKNRRVAISRSNDYLSAVETVNKSRSMGKALASQEYYFTAVIPGCGDEACEITSEMWSELVQTLAEVVVTADEDSGDNLNTGADAQIPERNFSEGMGQTHDPQPLTTHSQSQSPNNVSPERPILTTNSDGQSDETRERAGDSIRRVRTSPIERLPEIPPDPHIEIASPSQRVVRNHSSNSKCAAQLRAPTSTSGPSSSSTKEKRVEVSKKMSRTRRSNAKEKSAPEPLGQFSIEERSFIALQIPRYLEKTRAKKLFDDEDHRVFVRTTLWDEFVSRFPSRDTKNLKYCFDTLFKNKRQRVVRKILNQNPELKIRAEMGYGFQGFEGYREFFNSVKDNEDVLHQVEAMDHNAPKLDRLQDVINQMWFALAFEGRKKWEQISKKKDKTPSHAGPSTATQDDPNPLPDYASASESSTDDASSGFANESTDEDGAEGTETTGSSSSKPMELANYDGEPEPNPKPSRIGRRCKRKQINEEEISELDDTLPPRKRPSTGSSHLLGQSSEAPEGHALGRGCRVKKRKEF